MNGSPNLIATFRVAQSLTLHPLYSGMAQSRPDFTAPRVIRGWLPIAWAVLLTLKGGARRGLEPRKTYERLGVHPRALRTELGRLPWAS